MKYCIYKITNLINNKIYIGKHQTPNIDDDNYMGSGKLLKHAISKYGIQNFKREILFVFDTEEEMNSKEAELVTEEFCARLDSYNLCPGGHGGFGFINQNGLQGFKAGSKKNPDLVKAATIKRMRTVSSFTPQKVAEINDKISDGVNKYYETNSGHFAGKRHTSDTIRKMKCAAKNRGLGRNNSQFGTRWITDGIVNKKIKVDECIPDGFYRGRSTKLI